MSKVLGIEKNVVIDFFDKKQGVQVHREGLRLHLGEERKSVEGIAVDKPVFVNKTRPCYALAETLVLGDEIEVGYDKWGSFTTIVKN